MTTISDRMRNAVEEAASVLRRGGVILYPTDTVWGLGCDATDPQAVARVFAIKRRSDSKSLITLVSDADMLGRYVRQIPQMAIELLEVNDRPMTIIYPGAMGLAPAVIAEDGTAGIRIPMHEFCVQLIRRLRRPIVSTSANISGLAAPSSFDQISPDIISAVDWVADPVFEQGATGTASQIISVGLHGEIAIIRK